MEPRQADSAASDPRTPTAIHGVTVAVQTIAADQVRFWINQTEGMLSTLVEAGLSSDPAQRADVERSIERIAEARARAATGDLAGAASSMASADLALHGAYARQALFWRVQRHAPFEFLYLASLLCLLLVAGSGWRPGFLSWMPEAAAQIWGVPTAVLVWGALGAVSRSLYWLHKQVGRRIYRGHLGLTHYCAPLIGAVFGALAYLLLRAGLFTLGGASDGDANSALPSAVALLIGFKWEPLLAWIDRVRLPGGRGAARATPAAVTGGAGDSPPAVVQDDGVEDERVEHGAGEEGGRET